jgi:hypothetical protein
MILMTKRQARMANRGYAAVGLWHPKNHINIGAVLRACGCFGAAMLAVEGRRYRRAQTDTIGKPIYIPTNGCLNLAATVNVVLYPVRAGPSQGGDMTDHRYYVKYKAEKLDPPLTKEEFLATADYEDDWGAADAVFIVSMLYPSDGSYSQLTLSMDGRTGEPLEPDEQWKVWTVLAAVLAQREDLSAGRRALCKLVHDHVCAAIKGGAQGAQRPEETQ